MSNLSFCLYELSSRAKLGYRKVIHWHPFGSWARLEGCTGHLYDSWLFLCSHHLSVTVSSPIPESGPFDLRLASCRCQSCQICHTSTLPPANAHLFVIHKPSWLLSCSAVLANWKSCIWMTLQRIGSRLLCDILGRVSRLLQCYARSTYGLQC